VPAKPKDHLRKAPPRRTYPLKLAGELALYHVTMGAMSGADLIAVRSGELAEAEIIRLVSERMIEHDFDVASPLDLDYWILVDILAAWGTAMEDAAVPPARGER